jgi:branched-chain amino acid transport system ATP-binding protein
MAEILRVLNVTRRFGGLLALDRASFTADEGQIVVLIAPNGAGTAGIFDSPTGRSQDGARR